MNLTAHPYAVLAELQWKRDSLGGANRTADHPLGAPAGRRRAGRPGHHRPWGRLVGHLTARRPRHTPRPV
jgi:hypothetical protein